MELPLALYPIAIVQDRYGGVYSGGDWLAIARADAAHDGRSRVDFALAHGPHGSDCIAAEFWADPPDWIAVGNSPDEARDRLLESLSGVGQDRAPGPNSRK